MPTNESRNKKKTHNELKEVNRRSFSSPSHHHRTHTHTNREEKALHIHIIIKINKSEEGKYIQ